MFPLAQARAKLLPYLIEGAGSCDSPKFILDAFAFQLRASSMASHKLLKPITAGEHSPALL